MNYTATDGQTRVATVWSRGPLYGTVWAVQPDGTPVLIQATKRVEIPYTMPQWTAQIPPELEAQAQEVVDQYRAVQREFSDLGLITEPAGPDFPTAALILRHAELARKSRLPFINAHGPTQRDEKIPYEGAPQLRNSPSDAAMKKLFKEDA